MDSLNLLSKLRKKGLKWAIIGGIAGFFILIIAILSVVSYFLGFVQKNVQRVTNLAKGSCILCTNEELAEIKENQFYTKIRIWKQKGGSKIDAAVLASSVLFQGTYEEIIDAEYDKDFDEDEFSTTVAKLISGVTGDPDYVGIQQEQIDLIDAAALVMINADKNGKYDEDTYKAAIAGIGFDPDNSVNSTWVCGAKAVGDLISGSANIAINTLTFNQYSAITNGGNAIDSIVRFVDTISICDNGFIGGTFDGVADITDETAKQKKKDEIAQNIIDFANFYKELFPEDECTYSSDIGTGEITNWRQYDERWGSVPIGSSNVKSIGCTTTAVSYLIAKSGTALNYSDFNPGVYAQHGNYSGRALVWNVSPIASSGHVLDANSSGNMSLSNYSSLISNIINTPYNGKQQYITIQLLGMGGEHWIAVDHVEDGQVYVLDPSTRSEGLIKIEDSWRWGIFGDYRVLYFDDVNFGGSSSGSNSGSSSTDNSKVNKYLDAMKSIADDDSHGYSMDNRFGPDYDCSSFVYYALINSGAFDFSGNNPFITSDMGATLKSLGFTEIAYDKSKLQRGDIVVDPREGAGGHVTTIYSVDGDDIKQIAAHSNKDGKTGDSSGTEINVDDYTEGHHQYQYIYRLTGATDDNCESDTLTDEEFLEFIAYVEGVWYCNYRGQGANTGYGTEYLTDGAGATTAFGITQKYNADIAREVGYSDFNSDLNNGCVSKEYINKMVTIVIAEHKKSVESDLSARGITGLTNSQKLALTSIQYNTGSNGGYRSIVDRIDTYGADSFEVFKCFTSNTCSWAVSGYDNGLVSRRMAEYELYMTGNYKAAKPTENYSYFSGFTKSDLENYKKRWPTSR